MTDLSTQRMPTGVASLDPALGQGVPPGSVILLLGEVGAGMTEFVYSSILSLSRGGFRAGPGTDLVVPAEVVYLTLTRMKEDIRREVALSFNQDLRSQVDAVRFEDLSDLYFNRSTVPATWYGNRDLLARMRGRPAQENSLASLAASLDQNEKGSLVVLDSITGIAPQFAETAQWNNFIAFLRGLQRVSKEWGTTVYLLLTSGILDPRKEREIADTADAVVHFRWQEDPSARRQRVMYFEKFSGLMPHLEERDLVKFAVRVTPEEGFEVSNIRVVI